MRIQEENIRIQREKEELLFKQRQAEREQQELLLRQQREKEQMMVREQQRLHQEKEEKLRQQMQKQQEQTLEDAKKKEYENWLKSQMEQAEQYTASVKYRGPTVNPQTQNILVEGSQQQQMFSTTTVQHKKTFQNTGYQTEVSSTVQERKPPSLTQRPSSAQGGVFGSMNGGQNNQIAADPGLQKHSVKSLARHFATVQPKAEIPLNILPDIKTFNGQEGPKLNYLGTNNVDGKTTPAFTKKAAPQHDFESS